MTQQHSIRALPRCIPQWLAYIVVIWTMIAVIISMFLAIEQGLWLKILLRDIPAWVMIFFGWFYILNKDIEKR